ncbi:hypothetical protein [Longirhabdus pacifica]|uniref:hypothetical protein n=1 Tax=Longirhabdus pacifica TaxID=2305227 RepID=UPI0010092060|nr:hypothetical protein [Longirhabdus pacifica]
MNFKKNWMLYVILFLMAIGLLRSNYGLLVGMVVIVFILYKLPPNKWKMMYYRYTLKRMERIRKKKKSKFKVIDGHKKEENDVPKYH